MVMSKSKKQVSNYNYWPETLDDEDMRFIPVGNETNKHSRYYSRKDEHGAHYATVVVGVVEWCHELVKEHGYWIEHAEGVEEDREMRIG